MRGYDNDLSPTVMRKMSTFDLHEKGLGIATTVGSN